MNSEFLGPPFIVANIVFAGYRQDTAIYLDHVFAKPSLIVASYTFISRSDDSCLL